LEGETPPISNVLFPVVFENEASTPLIWWFQESFMIACARQTFGGLPEEMPAYVSEIISLVCLIVRVIIEYIFAKSLSISAQYSWMASVGMPFSWRKCIALQWQEKHGDAGKTYRRSVYSFIFQMLPGRKSRLKRNVVMAIQIMN
jgi:hypothetical protein